MESSNQSPDSRDLPSEPDAAPVDPAPRDERVADAQDPTAEAQGADASPQDRASDRPDAAPAAPGGDDSSAPNGDGNGSGGGGEKPRREAGDDRRRRDSRSGGANGGDSSRSGSRRKGGGKSSGPAIDFEKAFKKPLLLAKFGQMRRLELFPFDLPETPMRGSKVVIRTDRGVELGEVITVLLPTDDAPRLEPDESVAPDDPTPATPDPSAATDPASQPPSDRPGDSADDGDFAPGADDPADGCGSCASDCMIGADRLRRMLVSGEGRFPLNRQNQVLRMASAQDVNDQEHLDTNTREKKQYCRRQAEELGLKMRISSVEHLLGGERIIFYFTSDSRVDFRELVRRLASQYRTRIEMRQIGARDEARLIADYERCGRHCCCQSFLGELQPVSIRMAKVQKATLDPSKISGRCNRLMCCLCYEDQTYEQLRRKLPRRNLWISTDEVVGRVIDTQIITQLVRVIDAKGAIQVVSNDAIIKRNLSEPPEPPVKKAAPPVDEPEAVFDAPTPDETRAAPAREDASGDARAKTPGGEAGGAEDKSRRRRRPRKSRGGSRGSRGGRDQGAADKRNAGGSGDGSGSGSSSKRRRRRRKPRGPRSSGGDSPGGGSGGGNSGGGKG